MSRPKVIASDKAMDPTVNNLMVGSTTSFTNEEWNRQLIVDKLSTGLGIKPETADTIAQAIEVKLADAGLETVTTAEIRTLVQAELLARGMRAKFKKGNLAVMSFHDLEALAVAGNQENSNVPHNPEAINLYISENITKQFALDSGRVFSPEVSTAHKDGYIHLHDLGLAFRPYSFLHSEAVLVKVNDAVKLCSFERLFLLAKHYCKIDTDVETVDTSGIDLSVWDKDNWTKVTRVLKHKTDKKILAIRAHNGHTVCVTEDHPFLVSETEELDHKCICGSYDTIRNGGLTATTRAYKCLECGTCFTQPLQQYSETLVAKPASNITRASVCLTQATTGLGVNRIRPALSEEQAWFIGYFIAEGFYDNGNAIAIRANDVDRAFNSLSGSFMGVDVHPKLDAEGRLRVYSKEFALLLENKLGIAAYSHRKSLPDDFPVWPVDLQAAIVSGIIDGDGTVKSGEYSPEVSIRVTSKTLVSQLQWWLRSLDVAATVTAIASYGPREFNGKVIESKLPLYSVSFTLTQDIVALLNKCDKLADVQLYTRTRSKGPVSNFSRVSDIRHIDNTDREGYVYDITTASGTFVCGGIVVHNCSGNSPAFVIRHGLSSKAYTNPSKPAKHLMVLINHIKEFSSLLQGHFAGAIGWDAVNTFLSPFVAGLSDEQIMQAAQDMIFSFSQLLGTRGGQAIFSDLNFYYEVPRRYKDTFALGKGGWFIRRTRDKYGECHDELVEDLPKNPTMFKENKVDGFLTYQDFEAESRRMLKALIKVYRAGDANGLPFFFPKANVHITQDFWRTPDHDGFLELMAEAASANGSLYFVMERGDTNVISQCCLIGSTMVLVKQRGEVRYLTIRNVCNFESLDDAYIWSPTGWAKLSGITIQPSPAELYTVTLSNGSSFTATPDHPQVIYKDGSRVETRVDGLEVGQLIPVVDTAITDSAVGDEELGRFVGLYAAEGHQADEYSTRFCFNRNETALHDFVVNTASRRFGALSRIDQDAKWQATTVDVKSRGVNTLLKEYIRGQNAPDKELTQKVFGGSMEFRLGFIRGFWEGDGYDRDWCIHTAGEQLASDLCCLLSSMGLHYSYRVNDKNRDKEGNPYTSYVVTILADSVAKLEWSDTKPRQEHCLYYRNVMQDGTKCLAIASIVKVSKPPRQQYVYDVEVDTEDHLFALANGIVTHNCRLRVNMTEEELEVAHKEPWKLRFAALQNITLNMPRMAIEAAKTSKDVQERKAALIQTIDKFMHTAVEAHIQKKKFIAKLLALKEHGPLAALTYDQDGAPYFNLGSARYLIGVIGLNETVQALCGKQLHESKAALDMGLEIISFMYMNCRKLGAEAKINLALEQTPAESTAYRFAKLDFEKYTEAKELVKGDVKSGAIYYTNCVSEDTEILTENGWKQHTDIQINDYVWAFNLETKMLERTKVRNIYRQQLESTTVMSIKNRHTDEIVTPNHMVVFSPLGNKDNVYSTVPHNLPSQFYIPCGAPVVTADNPKYSDDMLALLGWIVSEGHYPPERNFMTIAQSEAANKKKFDEIEALLTRLGFNYRINTASDGNKIAFRLLKEDAQRIWELFPVKEIQRDVLENCSSRQLSIVLDSLLKGDGTRTWNRETNAWEQWATYSTKDTKIAEQIQELILKTGARANIYQHPNANGMYAIRASKYSSVCTAKSDIEEQIYTGTVWCVETDLHTWVARRNGKPFITGNSTHMAADAKIGIIDRITMEGLFHGAIDAGSITHGWIGDSTPNTGAMATFIRKIYDLTSNDQVVFSPTFTQCKACSTVSKGELKECPKCKCTEVTYVTRVTGYYGEVDKWNKGKQQEQEDRIQHSSLAEKEAFSIRNTTEDIILYGKVGCSICESTNEIIKGILKRPEFSKLTYRYEVMDQEKTLDASKKLADMLGRNVRDIPALIIHDRSWSVKMPTATTIEHTLQALGGK